MPVLTPASINAAVVAAEYGVRGELAIAAEKLRRQLLDKPGTLPFERITSCNIGNPQQLGQVPLTLFRQMLALLEYPSLISAARQDKCKGLFFGDAVERVESLISSLDSGIGAYTHSQGALSIRQAVASFIAKRDSTPPPNPDNIFLTNGASEAVRMTLQCIIADENVGILVPVPQYPLYSATITMLRGRLVPYYLCEDQGWMLDIDKLKTALETARAAGTDVRALVVINPGNPSGGCLSKDILQSIVQFCRSNSLVLLADEVYQTNVYGSNKFYSMRQCYYEIMSKEWGSDHETVDQSMHNYNDASATVLGPGHDDGACNQPPHDALNEAGKHIGKDQMQLPPLEMFSFHSTSKGFIGECGHRGGYMDLVGIDSKVCLELYKIASVALCPNIAGQLLVWMMVSPPHPEDDSFDSYAAETRGILESLERRANKLRNGLMLMRGVSCQPAAGAMYLFPRLEFPSAFVEHAKTLGRLADTQYALELLHETGICVTPGSSFGQAPNSLHIRTTFLPPENEFDSFIMRWSNFHAKLVAKYGYSH